MWHSHVGGLSMPASPNFTHVIHHSCLAGLCWLCALAVLLVGVFVAVWCTVTVDASLCGVALCSAAVTSAGLLCFHMCVLLSACVSHVVRQPFGSFLVGSAGWVLVYAG
jgi:hypothetical protein